MRKVIPPSFWTRANCATCPDAAQIRAMSTKQVGELIDAILDNCADDDLNLDPVSGPIFDVAWAELMRRVPLEVEESATT